MPFKKYYELAKPGILYGNAITVIGAFFLVSKGMISWWLLLATLIGISLVMASGCVFNNYIDRDIDSQMSRTKERALAKGQISNTAALVYATILGVIGFLILALYTNRVATVVAVLGFFFYVVMYSLWWKRRSPFGTFIGSISGAVPPVVGYVAVTGRVDIAAIILFAIMVVWQMPHFFAIAIRRADEYAAAKVPVLPVARGVRAAKVQMLLYIIAFIIIAPLLTVFGYTGYVYLVIALILGLIWLGFCIQGLRIVDGDIRIIAWARKVFLWSLVVIVLLFATLAFGTFI